MCEECGVNFSCIPASQRFCSRACAARFNVRGRETDIRLGDVDEEGQTRRCSSCDIRKPFSDWYGNRSIPTGECKTCAKGRTRKYRLMEHFGITPEEYDAILAFQGGVCAGCKKAPKSEGNALAVDHDHASGLTRGCLCWECNALLGKARDSLSILKNLHEYLLDPPAVTALGREVYGRKGRVTNKRKRRKRKNVGK